VVARLSSEALKDSFWFPKKLGQRLAELRKKQDLTQQQMAVLMGRQGRGNWTLVSALELGRMRTPSLRLVGDYLRACRASFDDVLDILNSYTRQATAADKAGAAAVGRVLRMLPRKTATEVLKYDAKRAAARRAEGEMPERAAGRQLRARKLARYALLREKLHQHVKQLINIEHLDRNWQDRRQLLDHARKLLGALNREEGTAQGRPRLTGCWPTR
jgi:transcriptional regulator with XRE-family HTH domain